MKHLVYLMLIVLGTAAFVSCSKDDDENNEPVYHYGVITMVIPESEWDNNFSGYIYTFNIGDTITIDYGDGNVQEVVANESYDEYDNLGNFIAKRGNINFDYTYSDREEHTITIKGNISGIDCNGNPLISLDASNCTALTTLVCYDNQLTSLDVSNCTALIILSCCDNQLTSLDVRKNRALIYLDCAINQLNSLDVSKNTSLLDLDCYSNQLTSLDVTQNIALTYLDCYRNQFTAAEMNKIYEALPIVEYGYLYCDPLGYPSIAEQKGWTVTFN